jgi:hypothetical protein
MSRRIGWCTALPALALVSLCFMSSGGASGATSAVVHLGARYYGRANNSNYVATVWVASRRTAKSTFTIAFTQGRCSDGGAYNGIDFPLRHQGFKINASGGAAFVGYYKHAYSFTRRGRMVRGHEHFAVMMQFAGDSVIGVLTDTFSSRRLHCSSGPVSFAAWREGTAGAPLNTSYASTGWYRGRSRYGETMSMYVFVPLRWVQSLRITFFHGLRCSGGLRLLRPVTFRFYDVPINGTSFFTIQGHNSVTGGGYRYRQRWSIIGNPIRDPMWTFVVTSWRHSQRVGGTCSTPPGGDQFRLKPPHGRHV